jgi:hypothetical protein
MPHADGPAFDYWESESDSGIILRRSFYVTDHAQDALQGICLADENRNYEDWLGNVRNAAVC